MRKKNRFSQGKGKKPGTKSRRSLRVQRLEKAILKVGKQYPELAGHFVLAELGSRAIRTVMFQTNDDKGCKRWGKDPVTGELVCIEYLR